MKRVFTFTTDDREWGGEGWIPDWMPGYNGIDKIAHDLLHHFPNEQDGTESELQAVGAILWTHVEGGAWRPPLRGDERQTVDYWLGGLHFNDITLDIAWSVDIKPIPDEKPIEPEIDGTIDMHKVMRWARKEWAGNMGDNLVELQEGSKRLRKAEHEMINWVRRGYRLARKQYYRGADPHAMAELFSRINSQVPMGTNDGDRLVVHVNPKTATAKMVVQSPAREDGYGRVTRWQTERVVEV